MAIRSARVRSRFFALPLALAILGASPATLAQSTPTGAAQSDLVHAKSLSRAFQQVARQVGPSVVYIKQYQTVNVRRNFFDAPAPMTREVGEGSGFIVSDDGYILTNHHVVADAEKLRVVLNDGREFDAKVIGSDELTDVAVIKVDASNLPYVQLADSEDLEVGEWVVAIGTPFGLENSVTAGIVSAKGRSGIRLPNGDAYQDFIQTDAAVNPGNSGGPLINLDGQVVGINSAIYSRAGGYQGISFAVPSNMARAIMDTIVKNGRVIRGYLGFNGDDVPRERLNTLGLSSGVAVTQVAADGPAQKAGLRKGDIITSFNGRPVSTFQRLRNLIAVTPPGTDSKIEVVRDGDIRTISASIADRDRALGIAEITSLGLSVIYMSADELSARGYNGVSGMAVLDAVGRGLAAVAGFERGDLIVAVNGRKVESTDQFLQMVEERISRKSDIRFDVIRGNIKGNITVKP